MLRTMVGRWRFVMSPVCEGQPNGERYHRRSRACIIAIPCQNLFHERLSLAPR